jgi:hypothetical protein
LRFQDVDFSCRSHNSVPSFYRLADWQLAEKLYLAAPQKTLFLGGAAVYRCDNPIPLDRGLQFAEKLTIRQGIALAVPQLPQNQ